jgi:hypothetical protein
MNGRCLHRRLRTCQPATILLWNRVFPADPTIR